MNNHNMSSKNRSKINKKCMKLMKKVSNKCSRIQGKKSIKISKRKIKKINKLFTIKKRKNQEDLIAVMRVMKMKWMTMTITCPPHF